ncbi:hypothetical protein [Bifidobacterium simiarum]|uniref:hypothetical protein n=1 Tax=Bifidobacterium simiarum TaxID=2045441 RepID=UPI001BDCE1FC|nr:hypothetical protein [Bifidobacterium simiarum]MBT1166462.1 hypothetical protein [Bifidobacterium simiarum]
MVALTYDQKKKLKRLVKDIAELDRIGNYLLNLQVWLAPESFWGFDDVDKATAALWEYCAYREKTFEKTLRQLPKPLDAMPYSRDGMRYVWDDENRRRCEEILTETRTKLCEYEREHGFGGIESYTCHVDILGISSYIRHVGFTGSGWSIPEQSAVIGIYYSEDMKGVQQYAGKVAMMLVSFLQDADDNDAHVIEGMQYLVAYARAYLHAVRNVSAKRSKIERDFTVLNLPVSLPDQWRVFDQNARDIIHSLTKKRIQGFGCTLTESIEQFERIYSGGRIPKTHEAKKRRAKMEERRLRLSS